MKPNETVVAVTNKLNGVKFKMLAIPITVHPGMTRTVPPYTVPAVVNIEGASFRPTPGVVVGYLFDAKRGPFRLMYRGDPVAAGIEVVP